ncbi:MAG: GntR family transcriptional regulator [Verrucomicrobiae bacterium]|nr:GntR family transcriptional regulator [Verrucomicrobiae bacterium]
MDTNATLPTLAETAVARLREQIVSGEIPGGARLAEAAVAQGLGVSRVPVREALVRLERDGFVEFSPTGRARVKELSPGDFEELFTLRLALEPLAAKLAAPVLRADQGGLKRNVEKTRRAGSVREVTCLDLEFHELILVAAGNTRLLSLWRSLRGELELWLGLLHRQHQTRTRETREETVQAHLEILEGFAKESPAVCERILRRHILGWRDWLPTFEEVGA